MATFQLADIQANTDGLQDWHKNMLVNSVAANSFLQSGIAVNDARIDASANADNGSIVNIPTLGDIPDTDPIAGDDDPANLLVPEKLGTGNERAVVCHFNKGLETADIASSWMQQTDPMGHIASRIGAYWGRADSRQAANIARGVYNSELAAFAPGAADSIILDATGSTININSTLDAQQLRGDKKMEFVGMMVHSKVHTDLQKLGALVNEYDPETNELLFQRFDGKRVIYGDYDDQLIDGAGKYISILFTGGVMALGNGSPDSPLEYDRNAKGGDGSGIGTLISRRKNIIHPYGYRYTAATQAKTTTPSYAELLTANNWERSQLAVPKNLGMFYMLTD